MLSSLALGLALAACANLASVRTLGDNLQTTASDTSNVVAGEVAACRANQALAAEFTEITGQPTFAPHCDRRAATLTKLLEESKALQAYGKALSDLADDKYVSTDVDGGAVAATLTSLNVEAPVVTAVQTVFTDIEGWALAGYRQRKINAALSDRTRGAVNVIIENLKLNLSIYDNDLADEASNLSTVANNFDRAKWREREPIASAELHIRLSSVRDDVVAKRAALNSYRDALDALPKALATAASDARHPDRKTILEDVKTFARQAKKAHDDIARAFS
jgi:tetratricopeptide (TPR) repeat protein